MSKFISAASVTVTLNTITITGFSDSETAIELPEIILANEKVGADGQLTASGTGTRGGEVSVELLPTSRSVILLSSLAEQMKKGAHLNFNGTIASNLNGSSVQLINGFLKSYPPYPPLGKGAVGNMKYVFFFEQINGNFESADFS